MIRADHLAGEVDHEKARPPPGNLRHQAGRVVGDGGNRWPAVHRLDAATLFRLAWEKAPAGSVLHGTAESGVTRLQLVHAGVARLVATHPTLLDDLEHGDYLPTPVS